MGCTVAMSIFTKHPEPVLLKLKYFMWTYIHTYGKGKVHPKTGHEGPEGE
jgi:hypothetical protein